MSGYPIIFGEGVDPDAYQYFLRAGIESGTQTPTAYDNAASFNGTNQFLSIPSNSSLTVTGSSFTFAFWANPLPTTSGNVISKGAVTTGTREFTIPITAGTIRFQMWTDGTTFRERVASISSNVWTFVVCSYDAAAGTMGISLNGGAYQLISSVPAITQTNTNPLQIGAYLGPQDFYNAQLASVGFWKKALSASEVTALFNSGAGRTYASLDSGLLTNLVSWWALNGTSSAVSLTDSHGVVTGTPNNLTNNGSVTAPNIGPVVTSLTDSRRLISDFVRGIKSLGLWNSMVCWPLRSSQNASTTLTARSLGGLGTFDGTIAGVSASNWLSNGLDLPNDTGQIIFQQMSDFSSGITTGSVHSVYSLARQHRGIDFASVLAGSAGLWAPWQDNAIYWDCMGGSLRLSIGSGALVNTYYMWSGSSNGSSIFRNSTPLATGGPVGNLADTFTSIRFGNTSGINRFNGIASFVYILRSGLTQSQVASFYSQYRSTLGLGLGLP
jgi:hypothetical protein